MTDVLCLAAFAVLVALAALPFVLVLAVWGSWAKEMLLSGWGAKRRDDVGRKLRVIRGGKR